MKIPNILLQFINRFREPLTKIRNWFVEAKFLLDLSISFFTILNFTLLVITASDKLRNVIHVGTWTLVFFTVPIALVIAVVFGWFMDKVVNYQSTYYKTQMDRNPQFKEMLERIKNIEKIVNKRAK